MNQEGDSLQMGTGDGSGDSGKAFYCKGSGDPAACPKSILEGEMGVKTKGDHGGFPQLGKVCAQKDFFNVTPTWASSHCDR